jgi:LmbE family N-acetylglucosaminyl deacetylase
VNGASSRPLVLAPHPDDASLWLGGLAQRVPLAWLTVFSRCCWTIVEGSRPERTDAVSRRRAREDSRAAAALGVQLLPGLGFREAPLRGYPKVLLPDKRGTADPVIGPVTTRIQHVIRRARVPLVLAPLGAGGHIDHRIVAEAARRAAAATATPIAFYEDPNIKDLVAEDLVVTRVHDLLGSAAKRVEIALGRTRFERKLAALAAYRSQLSPEVINIVRAHAARCGYRERLYVTADPAGRAAQRGLRALLVMRGYSASARAASRAR